MKSMVFWTVLALAATFSASWVQKDEVSNPVAVVQQQVVPQFPVQAGGNMAQPSGEGPVVNAGPAPVVPRAIPGMPGPPPGTSVVVAQPIPGNPVRTLTRPVIIQPGAARPQPLAPPPGVAH